MLDIAIGVVLRLKTRLLCIKDGHVFLHFLSTGLLEGAWSDLVLCPHLILRLRSNRHILGAVRLIVTRSRHSKLQALTIEHLIVVKPWSSSVETDILS